MPPLPKLPPFVHIVHDSDHVFFIQTFFDVGSIHEKAGQRGISHFLEHMKFKKSQRFNGDEILRMLEANGTVYNAYTTKDLTSYYVRTIDRHYKSAIRMLCEISFNTRFEDNALDTERKVVLEEYLSDADGLNLWNESEMSTLDPANPYKYEVIGNKTSLKAITNRQLRHYHDTYYKKGHKAVVVMCHPDMEYRVRTCLLNTLERMNVLEESDNVVEPRVVNHASEREFSINVYASPSSQYVTMLNFAAYPRTDRRSYVLDFISYVLSSGLLSVLSEEIRERRGLVYTISSVNNSYRHVGHFQIYFASSNRNTVDIVETIFNTLFTLPNKLDANDLRRYKEAFADFMTYKSKQNTYVAEFVGKEMFYKPEFTFKKYMNAIDAITPTLFWKTLLDVCNPSKMGLVSRGNYATPLSRTLDNIEGLVQEQKKVHRKLMRK